MEKSALFKFEILGLIVNRLTADDKYSRRNIQNLTQELQTAISQKQKTFSGIFITFFCFSDIAVWSSWVKFWVLRQEYLSSAVNLLTVSPKISNLNKADFLHFNLFPIHGAIGY